MYADEALLPISALQHLIFCERQCALIHLEQVWLDNRFTVEGNQLHRTADDGKEDARGELVIVRSLSIQSRILGLTGRADVVEFRRSANSGIGTRLENRDGLWQPTPVEYKRGHPKLHRADEVQLCAQALCLEEIFDISMQIGHIFYGARRRRTKVLFDEPLRTLTQSCVRRLRHLLDGSTVPRARYSRKKCEPCSLMPVCLPQAPADTSKYVQRELANLGFDPP